jgi:hypothetical protein
MNACSSDEPYTGDDNGKGNGNGTEQTDPEVTYVGSTAYSKGILFNKATELGNGDQEFVFTGDVTLSKGTYLLKGWVYVAEGAKLRIPAGTVIKGDKQTKSALIVERGGYVEMKGNPNEPIVMTSEEEPGNRRPGDWGGLVICGKAKNNQKDQQIEGGPRTHHGGEDDADNSGIFQYIRVEFAGYPFDTDKEINGITLGSVGSGTVIDHIQVSYSNDDSFEWFGGAVNCSYLVAYKGWDDDFDTDNGYSGTVQYALSIRDPRIADTSQSNGFESDNNANGSDTAPFTNATFKNVTLIGPATLKNDDFQNNSNYITAGNVNPNNGSKLGKFQSALQIRRSSKLNIENMLAIGFPIGVIIDGDKGKTPQYAANGEFHLKNVWLAGMTALGSDANKKYEDELLIKDKDGNISYDTSKPSYSHTFFVSEATNKVVTEAELSLTDPMNTGQNYCPTTTLSDGNGGYIGAFKGADDNWLKGWTNFDPQNTTY